MERLSHLFFDYNMRVTVDWRDDRVKGKEETDMQKGKIIFLNDVTSAGKTSIVDALQSRREVFFYVVANDLFEEMVGEQYLRI